MIYVICDMLAFGFDTTLHVLEYQPLFVFVFFLSFTATI